APSAIKTPSRPMPAVAAPPPVPPPFELSAPGEGFSDLDPSGASGQTAAASAPLEAEEPFFRSQGEDEDTGKIHLPQQVMAKGTKVRLVFVAGLAFVGLAVLVTFKVGSSSRPRAKVTSSLMPAMPPKPAGTSTPAEPPSPRPSELPAKATSAPSLSAAKPSPESSLPAASSQPSIAEQPERSTAPALATKKEKSRPPSPGVPPKKELNNVEKSSAPVESGPESQFAKHINLAKAANQSSNFKGAVNEYRKALELRPESAEAKAGLGIALVNSDPGESGYVEAVKLLQQSVKSHEKNARAWLALGMAYQFTRKDEQAVAAYKKYLQLDPNGQSSAE